MGSKAPEAFRTISEVSEILETPPHVLRFWESKFTQVRPVKRAGGRRYYRPSDLELLAGIKQLLHEDGMTIRGVQKLLREQGVRHVAAMGMLPPGVTGDIEDETVQAAPQDEPAPLIEDLPQSAASTTPPPDEQPEAPPEAKPEAPVENPSETRREATPALPDAPETTPAEAAPSLPGKEPARAGQRSFPFPTSSDTPSRPARETPAPEQADNPGTPHPAADSPPSEAPATAALAGEDAADGGATQVERPLPAARLRGLRPLPDGPRREALRATLARMRALHARMRDASDSIAE